MNTFEHYSFDPALDLDANRGYRQQDCPKPTGLWSVPVNADVLLNWRDFCVSFDIRYDRFEGHYLFELDESNVLRLSTKEDVIAFSNEYKDDYYCSTMPGFVPAINWAKVASEYKGIIISPYQYMLRHKLLWYYTWDIASACVWDNRIVHNWRKA